MGTMKMKSFNFVKRWKRWRIGKHNAKLYRLIDCLKAEKTVLMERGVEISPQRYDNVGGSYYESAVLNCKIRRIDENILDCILNMKDKEKEHEN